MDYIFLPNTGLQVSRLCLGSSNFGRSGTKAFALDQEDVSRVVEHALEIGITYFDSAEIYELGSSESALGASLRRSGAERADLVISTKVGGGAHAAKRNRSGLSRKHILSAVEESLNRLQLDYIDIYSIHRFDSHTPVEETLDVLNEVVRAGKVRYLGASSMYAWQFEHMISLQEKNGWARFSVMQNQYSLNYREEEREMIPLCQKRGIGMTPWGILCAGLLAGNITRTGERLTARSETDLLRGRDGRIANSEQDFDIQDRVRNVAERTGATMAEVAMAWALSKPYVTAALIGVSRPDQIDGCLRALDLDLGKDEVAYLEQGYRPVFPQTLT